MNHILSINPIKHPSIHKYIITIFIYILYNILFHFIHIDKYR